MKEAFEISAIRLAQLILGKRHRGQLKEARRLAEHILRHDEPSAAAAPLSPCREQENKPAPLDPDQRWMIRRDMEEVLQIEAASFDCPWPEEEFIRQLRQRNVIGWVAEREGMVIGFMVYKLHTTRLHLSSLAVHPSQRRRGVGRALVDRLIFKLHPERRVKITLDIREQNLAGQLFFRSCGFVATEVAGDFFDNGEGAIHMEYRIRREQLT